MIKFKKESLIKVTKKGLKTFGQIGKVVQYYRYSGKVMVNLTDGGTHVYNADSVVAITSIPQGIHEGCLVIRKPYNSAPKIFTDRAVALVLEKTVSSAGNQLVRVKIISSDKNINVGKVLSVPSNIVCSASDIGCQLGCWKNTKFRFGLSPQNFTDFVNGFDGLLAIKEHEKLEEEAKRAEELRQLAIDAGEIPAFYMVATHIDGDQYPATDHINHQYAPRMKYTSEDVATRVAKDMKDRYNRTFYVLKAYKAV